MVVGWVVTSGNALALVVSDFCFALRLYFSFSAAQKVCHFASAFAQQLLSGYLEDSSANRLPETTLLQRMELARGNYSCPLGGSEIKKGNQHC